MSHDPLLLTRATRHLSRVDPVLARLVREVGPCRLAVDRGSGHFASLVESIVYQQITGKAAAAIYARLCALCRRRPRPQDLQGLSARELRGVGLSRQKIGYLQDLAGHVQDGLALARIARLSDDDVVEALTAVKGIGRWTAEMFLIFRLGRLDVLPVDDYGVRKAMQRAWRKRVLPKPAWMREQGEAWRPYRSVASWYLWRSLETTGGRA
jgi:3-methyladenine DNA glycosylase/8-oxoguanine DNA glycosylase